MDELLQLLGLVDDGKKAQAQELVNKVKAKIAELDNKIVEQERLKLEAITSRDKVKNRLKEIAGKLGVSAENIDDALQAIEEKKLKVDDVVIKEKEQLEKEVEEFKSKYEQTLTQKEQEMRDILLERDLAMLFPKYNVREELSKYLIQEIKDKAKFEDGKLVFVNEDGTTLRIDGQQATLDTILEKKRKEEQEQGKSVFFDNSIQKSGGVKGGGSVEDDFFDN